MLYLYFSIQKYTYFLCQACGIFRYAGEKTSFPSAPGMISMRQVIWFTNLIIPVGYLTCHLNYRTPKPP